MDHVGIRNKRSREEFQESYPVVVDAKRLREDDLLFFDLLNDITDAHLSSDRSPASADEIATVMNSLEGEIGVPLTVSEADSTADADVLRQQPDLGYLLEASDDELGIPPVDVATGGQAVNGGSDGPDSDWFGQIWGFDDEISGGMYGGVGVGFNTFPLSDDDDRGSMCDQTDSLYSRSDLMGCSWWITAGPLI